jgi:phosphoribosyl-AMP cyclohydrolase
MSRDVEEGLGEMLDFTKLARVAASSPDVLPVVVQDADNGSVLVLAYANRQALEHTLRERVATFWSTSRNELWVKGASSGDYLDLVEVRVNCEQNSLLYIVRPAPVPSVTQAVKTGATARRVTTARSRRTAASGSFEESVWCLVFGVEEGRAQTGQSSSSGALGGAIGRILDKTSPASSLIPNTLHQTPGVIANDGTEGVTALR